MMGISSCHKRDENMENKRNSKNSAITKAQRDNRANQLNPNNQAYWKSRGINKYENRQHGKN